ncbi:MAG: phosphoglucosamine mutase [Clostridia bacterium]|nr:phosphoglucosamine mutase [Clostridia bacterium]
MGKLFGTDGVRGIANVELTSDLAFKLGQACAYVLAGEVNHVPNVLVGTDTRISCDMLESALNAGLCSVGTNVIKVGVIPTPGVAYLTRKYKADAGVVISASHNSFEFNGIKFFDSDGYKLPDEIEENIEEFILSEKKLPHKTGTEIGRIFKREELIDDYVDFLVSTVDIDLTGMKIIIDCANGAAYQVAKRVFDRLGVDTTVLFDSPDGININHHCGSTHIDQIISEIKKDSYDIGFAYDGDADRVMTVCERGNLIDGDRMLGALAIFMKEKNLLSSHTIVATIMSNMGLEKLASDNQMLLTRTKVGDRYVVEEMKKNNHQIGGEQSGHIILNDYNTTGDGILTSLKLLSMLRDKKMKASTMIELMIEYPQVTVNAKVKNHNKAKLFDNKKIMELYHQIENQLSVEGRIILRPSGTEPIVRVMIEGKDITDITEKANQLGKLIEKTLG